MQRIIQYTTAAICGAGALLGATMLPAQTILDIPTSDPPPYEREHLQTNPAVYVRYTRPGQCQATGYRAYYFYYRDRRADTLIFSPNKDTLPDAVAATVRACATRIHPEQVSVHDLPSLVFMYLWAKQPELAEKTRQQLLASLRDSAPERQAVYLDNLLSVYQRSVPVRVSEMQPLVARLDSLGAPGAPGAVKWHRTLADRSYDEPNYAFAAKEGEASVRAAARIRANEQIDYLGEVNRAYDMLTDDIRLLQGVPPALTIPERAKVEFLGTFERGSTIYQMVSSWIGSYTRDFDFYGNPVPAIEAQHWFNKNGDTAVRPRSGKATLVIYVQQNCGAGCYNGYALLRRLHREYGDKLDIVFVANTNGYFRMRITENTAAEVEMIRQYFLDFLDLPVTLAVYETQFARKLDGRVIGEPSLSQQQWPRTDIVLFDKNANIKYLSSTTMLAAREALLKDQINQALR